MGRVRRTTGVHEKTVQKVAKNAIAAYPNKRSRASEKRSRTSKVVVSHWSDGVDPMIVNYVRVNQIHHSRIQVVSPGEIIILNGDI